MRDSIRVCPRCGKEAGNSEYCQTCGLHLWAQAELPTHAQWEAGEARLQGGKIGFGQRSPRDWWNRRTPREKVLIPVVAALAICGIAIAAAGSGGGGKADPADDSTEVTVNAGPPPEQGCIDSWNATPPEDNFGKTWIQLEEETYAAVGFSADFPDQCLVTLAVPRIDQATQVQETNPGEWTWQGNSSVSQIPVSAKQWNATRSSDGSLSLGAP